MLGCPAVIAAISLKQPGSPIEEEQMKALGRGVCLLLALLSLVSVAGAQSGFYLKDGDRVVFYGDSITDQRLYTTFVETYVVTRFPKMDVAFIHAGWGGDRVPADGGGPIDVRLNRDVIAHTPRVMTVNPAMSDATD